MQATFCIMLLSQFFSTRRTLPLSVLVFHHLSGALAQLQVQLNFYTDNQCKIPSTEQATASVPISKCIVTVGLGSISFQTVPCSSGHVWLIPYSDSVCGTQLGILDWYKVTNECSAPYQGDIAAIMFTCNQPTDAGTIDPGMPTATSTAMVGQVANAASTPTQSTASGMPSSSSDGSATATQTAALGSPSGSGGGITNGNGTGDTKTTSPSPSLGLSTNDIISLAVGLGVGIPTIIIGLISLKRRNNRRRRQLNSVIGASQQMHLDSAYSLHELQ